MIEILCKSCGTHNLIPTFGEARPPACPVPTTEQDDIDELGVDARTLRFLPEWPRRLAKRCNSPPRN